MDKLGHVFAEVRTLIERAKKEDPKKVTEWLYKMPNDISPREVAAWQAARTMWALHETPEQ